MSLLALWLGGTLGCGSAPPSPSETTPAPQVSAPAPPAQPALTGPSEPLGGTRWLLPGLSGVQRVVPDRPHRSDETGPDGGLASDATGRVVTFTVSTTDAGLRLGPPGSAEGPVVLALGDGTTFGWGVEAEQAWPARLAVQLSKRGVTAQVHNVGVPGAQVRDLARWCETEAPALAPAWILWSAHPHPNDPPPFTSYFNSLRRCARAAGAPILVALPPVSSFDRAGLRLRPLAVQILSTRVAAEGHRWLDLGDAVPPGQDLALVQSGGNLALAHATLGRLAVAPETSDGLPAALLAHLDDNPDLRERGFRDQHHPDPLGHDRIATSVADLLAPALTPPIPPP